MTGNEAQCKHVIGVTRFHVKEDVHSFRLAIQDASARHIVVLVISSSQGLSRNSKFL
jgi:hypothetical protein